MSLITSSTRLAEGTGKLMGSLWSSELILPKLELRAAWTVIDLSFYPAFAAPKGEEVGVEKIADHVEHIADRIGRHQ
jgi:hypothetical protein